MNLAANEDDVICSENASRWSKTLLSTLVWERECMRPGSTVSDSLETLSVLQVQNQAVGTQVHFVLGLRHLGVKQIVSETFVDLSKKKKNWVTTRKLRCCKRKLSCYTFLPFSLCSVLRGSSWVSNNLGFLWLPHPAVWRQGDRQRDHLVLGEEWQ